jgi:hypothetical protein
MDNGQTMDNTDRRRFLASLAGNGSRDALILTMPGIGQKVIVEGRLRCAPNGTILLRKL